MSLFKNPVNCILFKPEHGLHIDKNYLFEESNKRWQGIRSYVKSRKEEFKDSHFFCITGLDKNDKWKYGNYQDKPSSSNLPLPEIIYDIKRDKVYVFKGQLWDLITIEQEQQMIENYKNPYNGSK